MKLLQILITFVLLSSSYTMAATIPSQSCSYSHVNQAVEAANRGDTVIVPACSETVWSTTLTVTKSITLQGAGPDKTTIAAGTGISGNGLVYFTPSDSSAEAGYTFRVTGFTLDTKGISTDALHIRNMSGNYVQILIDMNKFLDNSPTSTYRMLRNEGTIKGVIHSNLFNTSKKKMVDSYGRNTINDWSSLTFSYGSENNIYIEDNTFIIADTPHSVGQGGRHVLRYNSYTNNKASTLSPWFDAHGNQDASTCVSWSTRGAEWYGNIITSTNNKEIVGISQRGGQALGFVNKVVTSAGGNNFHLWEEYVDSSCSTTYTQHVNNSYYWANFINTTPITYQITMDVADALATSRVNNNPPVLVANVTHWTQPSSFDGTTGVGCGTLSDRPIKCATGVGYWATDQSCSDLTEMVGANPKTPISGTLYKCTAPNTWTTYYTPFPYPHPLRKSLTELSPPTGVKIAD